MSSCSARACFLLIFRVFIDMVFFLGYLLARLEALCSGVVAKMQGKLGKVFVFGFELLCFLLGVWGRGGNPSRFH